MEERTLSTRRWGQRTWNKFSIILLKILLAVVLIWFLASHEIIEFAHLERLYENYAYVLSAAGIFLVTIAIAAYRWHLLLAAQNVHLPLITATKVVGASNAMGIVLAGVVGGEGFRAAWILGTMRSQRLAALLSLPLDRACGLLGLLTIAAISVVLRWDQLMATVATASLAILTVSLFAATVAVVPIGHWCLARFRLGERIVDWENAGRWKNAVWRLVQAIKAYRDKIGCLVACFFLSILTNALTIVAFLLLFSFMPTGTLDTVEIVLAFVLGTLANVFAITPGGIGIGEGAFEALCRLIGGAGTGAGYATLFFMFRIVTWIPLVAILSAIFLGRWQWRTDAPTS